MSNIRTISDEELVEYVRKKDIEAYSEIIKRYESKLMRYAQYLTGDVESSQDAVQQAFISAYKNLNGFNAKRKFSSWIYRIVHNEAMNLIRRRKREMPLIEGFDIEDSIDLEKEYSKLELSKMVRNCLKDMPIAYREPLGLYYLEDKQYSEISDILRIPISTVGVRISRAKNLMKKICKRQN